MNVTIDLGVANIKSGSGTRETRLQFGSVDEGIRASGSQRPTPRGRDGDPSYSRMASRHHGYMASFHGRAFKEKFLPSAEAAKTMWNSSRLPFAGWDRWLLALSRPVEDLIGYRMSDSGPLLHRFRVPPLASPT